ncbi:hypothetical protein ES692_10535 [Psychroserpens burtonensis]|uniref:Uncharacterized protein n=1 Tax=Psychroserpens burtonensis TaxID=49278 RepID=A0A5C7B983_9FLAO|nr:hypothetical protein [Psychroserpens burtonensis]TXE17088.1 hypothetical protein ES692_10535 [Psychroserpens burtonensis]
MAKWKTPTMAKAYGFIQIVGGKHQQWRSGKHQQWRVFIYILDELLIENKNNGIMAALRMIC